MNRLLVVFLAVFACVVGFGAMHRSVARTRTDIAVSTEELKARENRLAETQAAVTALKSDVAEKKNQLRTVTRHPSLSRELIRLLEENESTKHSPAWAELRQQLGIGWDTSPDYLLVRKQALKGLEYPRLLSGAQLTPAAAGLLALSPAAESSLESVLRRVREEWQGPGVVRTAPEGDVVAQYTMPSTHPELEQNLSNNFALGIVSAVGTERADLLLPQAWREFKSEPGPAQEETMTIRRSVVDGVSDLICEMKQGERISTMPVRYAHYPSSWFLKEFPGGWKTLADREGFELPQAFQP